MKKIKLSDDQIEKASEILSKFNNYDQFSSKKKDSYAFTKIVDVKICPYCNINYISTVFSEDKEILRPDIDHYFCKKTYKEWQLRLHNLIPSCSPCNARLKRDEDFMLTPHIHPYFHDFDSVMYFCVKLKESANYLDEKNLELSLVPYANVSKHLVTRAQNNIATFKLEERYQLHSDQVVDLFKKVKYYWNTKKEEINRLLSAPPSSYLPIERILFPEKDCDINQVSLGKLKKDIINRYCLRK